MNTFLPLPQFVPADPLDTNVRGTNKNIINNNQYLFRVDHNFTTNDKVWVRYITDRGRWDQGDPGLNPNFGYFVTSLNWNMGVQYVKIFSPTVVNEFRYGINKSDNNTLNPRSNTDFDPDSLGVGRFRKTDGSRFAQREVGIPPISGITSGDRDGGNGYDFNTVHQFADNVSINRGKHNFKTGFEYRYVMLDRAAANEARGTIGCCPGGYALAGFLQGYVSNTTTGEGLPYTSPRQNRWSAYF